MAVETTTIKKFVELGLGIAARLPAPVSLGVSWLTTLTKFFWPEAEKTSPHEVFESIKVEIEGERRRAQRGSRQRRRSRLVAPRRRATSHSVRSRNYVAPQHGCCTPSPTHPLFFLARPDQKAPGRDQDQGDKGVAPRCARLHARHRIAWL